MSVASALRRAADTYERKALDYAPNEDDPYENFKFAAKFAARVGSGLPDWDQRRATLVLIGVKLSRMHTLGLCRDASNEAISDTIEDLMVYLAILKEQCVRETQEDPS